MITAPQITGTNAQIAAVIHLRIPPNEMRNVVPQAIQELMAALAAQGLKQSGPLFTHHLQMPSSVFDFEVGFPVDALVRPVGRVRPGELPAVTVFRTVHQGGYEGLAAAWGEFEKRIGEDFGKWMKEHGMKPDTSFWESYVAGPESDPDSRAWRTELNRPIIKDVT
jgi:effector-binding domain-containing protein